VFVWKLREPERGKQDRAAAAQTIHTLLSPLPPPNSRFILSILCTRDWFLSTAGIRPSLLFWGVLDLGELYARRR
jgi:hypothetical protein